MEDKQEVCVCIDYVGRQCSAADCGLSVNTSSQLLTQQKQSRRRLCAGLRFFTCKYKTSQTSSHFSVSWFHDYVTVFGRRLGSAADSTAPVVQLKGS